MTDLAEISTADGRHRGAGGGFSILIAGADLVFQERHVADPVPTGRQVAEAFAEYDPEEAIILQWLPNGMLEELRLDETTDLRARGVERYIVARSDRSFRLKIEGKRQEWPVAVITAATIKGLAGIDPGRFDDFDVFLARGDEPDLELADHDTVDLSAAGPEHFHLKRREREVEIFVNERPVRIERGGRTGLEIKQAAIAQGISIQADFLLMLEKPGGQSRVIGDQDLVEVRQGLRFTAVADDDNS